MSFFEDPTASHGVAWLLGDEAPVLRALLKVLRDRERNNLVRERFYEAEEKIRNMGIAVPEHLEKFMPVLGWPAKTVNVVSDRLVLEGFVAPNQAKQHDRVAELFELNQLDVEAPQTHTSALLHGCAFTSVTRGIAADGEPPALIRPYSALDATGVWNFRTRRLDHALTVDARDVRGRVLELNLWTAVERVQLRRGRPGEVWDVARLPHFFGRVPVVPFAHDTRLGRPFGASRITKPVMALTSHAVRTLLRTEISAEFFNAPQRYLLGADMEAFEDENGELKPGWEALIGHLLVASAPLDPDTGKESSHVPAAGQFAQQSMEPNIAQLRAIATMFSGETSIPVSYLGVVHDNPSSADAIRAAEADLVQVVEGRQRDFSAAWSQVAVLALQAARDSVEVDPELQRLRPRWRDASTPTKAAQAQAVAALVQANVLPPDSEVTYELLGFDAPTRSRLVVEAAARRADQALAVLTDPGLVSGSVAGVERVRAAAVAAAPDAGSGLAPGGGEPPVAPPRVRV